LTCSVGPSAVVFRINHADLDNTLGFNLSAASYVIDGNRIVPSDNAPDCVNTWNYRLAGPSTNPNPLCPAIPPPPPPEPPPPPLPPRVNKVYVPDCAGRPRFKPKSIAVVCRRGGVRLSGLRWSRWTSRLAVGTGVYRWHSLSRKGARIKLYRVARCRSKRLLEFSRIGVTPPRSLHGFKRLTKKRHCARSRRG
jgi:hypothetical protein